MASIKNVKLQNKLIASYILAALIPLMIVSLTIFYISTNSIKRNSLELTSILSVQIDKNVNEFIEEYDRVTKSVLVDSNILQRISNEQDLTMSERIENKRDVSEILNRIVMIKPEAQSILLLTRQNVFYYDKMNGMIDENRLKEQTWLNEIYDANRSTYITGVHDRSYFDSYSDGVVFTFCRKLYNSGGAYVGLLLMDLDPSRLIEFNQESLASMNKYGMKLIIANQTGEVVYHSDAYMGSASWGDFLDVTYDSGAVSNKSNNILSVNESENGLLVVYIEILKSSLFSEVRSIQYVALFSIILCFLFVVVVSIVISGWLTKPIKKLQINMKLAEQAQYDTIDTIQSKDEIGNLVDSYNSMIMKIKSLIFDIYIAEIKQKEAKFMALQTQINPHMLFNTLESIRMKAVVKGEEEISEMIKLLARMYKVILGKEGKNNYIRDEVAFVLDYLKVQNIRYDNHFMIQINLSEAIMNSEVILFVLQPVVENCVNHGFKDYDNLLHIYIDGEIMEDKNILLRITDDGQGISDETIDEINEYLNEDREQIRINTSDEYPKDSIGLKNIATRIKLYYGEEYYVQLKPSQQTGITVEMMIPKR